MTGRGGSSADQVRWVGRTSVRARERPPAAPAHFRASRRWAGVAGFQHSEEQTREAQEQQGVASLAYLENSRSVTEPLAQGAEKVTRVTMFDSVRASGVLGVRPLAWGRRRRGRASSSPVPEHVDRAVARRSRRPRQQRPQADQVICRGGEGHDPVDPVTAAVSQLAEAPDRLHPAEDLLD